MRDDVGILTRILILDYIVEKSDTSPKTLLYPNAIQHKISRNNNAADSLYYKIHRTFNWTE